MMEVFIMNKAKLIGSTCVVAGTAIGAGVLVLPIVCAKIGILFGLFLMGATWLVAYFTALVALELNLQSGRGSTLGQLGLKYSGRLAQILGDGSVQLLCYLLVIAYICGIADVMVGLFKEWGIVVDGSIMKHFATAGFLALLLLGVGSSEKWNRLMFAGICVILIAAIGSLLWISMGHQQSCGSVMLTGGLTDGSLLPVLFTSFGFQVIFHTLTDYCEKDKVVLKKAFLYGSLIPFFFYCFWTFGSLYVVARLDNTMYQKMVSGQVAFPELMSLLAAMLEQSKTWVGQALGATFKGGTIFLILSFLAIFTSIVGVSLGLATSWRSYFDRAKMSEKKRWVISVVATLLPAWLIAISSPGIFMSILAYAGCILTNIAIFLPLYLLVQQQKKEPNRPYYTIVNSRLLRGLSVAWGALVVFGELSSIFGG